MLSGWLKTSSYIVVPVEDDEQGRGRQEAKTAYARPQSNPDVKSHDRVRDCGPRVPWIESHHTRAVNQSS